MNEQLLQLIWHHSLVNINHLQTTNAEQIRILYTGRRNILDQGPDFLEAQIRIGDIRWSGNIEIDMKTSMWFKHKHYKNRHYENVILHIVWENDLEQAPHNIPILVLKHQVSTYFIDLYMSYHDKTSTSLPCQSFLDKIPIRVWDGWKDTLIIERIQRKAGLFELLLDSNHYDWDQSFWVFLASYMGGTQNKEAFENLARSISISIIYREKLSPQHVEALLLGTAGLLSNPQDAYSSELKNLFNHLSHKYNIQPSSYLLSYSRMRPYQFPDMRLVQLASLLFSIDRVSHLLVESDRFEEVISSANESIDGYWSSHYRIGKPSKSIHSSKMGKQFRSTLMINVFIVALYVYSKFHNQKDSIKKTLEALRMLQPERNKITRFWADTMRLLIKNALDSQSVLELQNNYCNRKKCLHCAVGISIFQHKDT